ncbi:MAG: CRISPR-associated helicase Cas3' [Methanomassiliicoccales archaeon]
MNEARDGEDFISFFKRATKDNNREGFEPFPYQVRLALDNELPQMLSIPTGMGKTEAIILSWIWRRRRSDEMTRFSTPRRLVYCLPMRVLVDQTTNKINEWLNNLQILGDVKPDPNTSAIGFDEWKSKIPVVVLMGGEDEPRWDDYPERDMIIIGTQDMLLSRALNRGYGMSRYRWPMQFGLLNNDCLWVFDEVQLMGPGISTSAQLQAFREKMGNFFPTMSIWMSATTDAGWLQTVDFDASSRLTTVFTLGHEDREEPKIQKRIEAKKILKKAVIDPIDPIEIASLVLSERKSGTLSIVVVNTVKRARAIFEAIEKRTKDKGIELILLHSQFRTEDRKKATERLVDTKIPDRICVATQVIEAGVDVSAHDLFIDVAPWTSIVQRIGRCNRFGESDDSKVYWIDVAADGKKESSLPYEIELIEQSRLNLLRLEGCSVSPGSIPSATAVKPKEQTVRKKDILDLFDTTPDLAGNDVDISRFIRDSDERSIKVFWRDLKAEGWMENMPGPISGELCPAPIAELRKFLETYEGYIWDELDGYWMKAEPERVRPGTTILLDSVKGGYTNKTGWNPGSKAMVEVLFNPVRGSSNNERKYDGQSSDEDWKTIVEHTELVKTTIEGISKSLALKEDWAAVLKEAAKWHDAGKAHPEFQKRMVVGTGRSAEERGPWAKAPKDSWNVRGNGIRKHFRHELLSGILARENGCSDIVCYLAAAHHGKVRMSLRSMPDEIVPFDPSKKYARGIWEGDVIPEFHLDSASIVKGWTVELESMKLGNTNGRKSWLAMSIGLRDDLSLGPFRLAFLEALIKAADERASGGIP